MEVGDEQQASFEAIEQVTAKEVLLSYPDFNKPFETLTNASDEKLGAVVIQSGKPIAHTAAR